MFTRIGSNIVTKMATAAVSAVRNIQQAARGKKNGCSENSANDMANIAAARRIVEQQQQQQQQQSSSYKKMKCEITKNYKNEADCTCKRMCMAKVSETMYIHQEEHQEQEQHHKKK
jgi:hypothetical protein